MKAHIIRNNFSSGELSPLLSARTDIAQYQNGARSLTNVLPLVEGGFKKRPGTYFKQELGVSAWRMIPFVVDSTNTFLLILGTSSLQVYNPRNNTIIATLTTPYNSQAKVKEAQYAHVRYSMYFTQGNHPMQWLRCSEDYSTWSFEPFVFDIPPVDEVKETPNVALTPSGKDLGATIDLNAAGFASWSATVNYNIDDKVWHDSKVWKCLVASVDNNPTSSPAYWQEVAGAAIYAFTANNIGDLVFINGGIVRITEYVSAFLVRGEVLTGLTAVVAAIPKAWTLKSPAFSESGGYPRCCAYFKQRLVLANTKTYPNLMWFSRIGDTHNFLPTINDADSFSAATSSDQSDNILHLAQSRGVVALTGGAEFLVSSEGPLTPTTVKIDEHTSFGAFPNVRPTRVGNELLFVQRGGERLRALSYRYEVDGIVSPELSTLASHIGEAHQGIVETTYQQEPESLVWCVMGDGYVSAITLNREQEVIAWSQHNFGGFVRSMCSLPTTLGSDLCFALVVRNGFTVLEQLSFTALTDCQMGGNVSALGVGNFGTAKYINTENMAAYAIGDYSAHTVIPVLSKAGNAVTLSTDEALYLSLGQLINCVAILMPIEVAQSPSSSFSSRVTIHAVYLYLYKTLGVMFNGALVDLQTFDDQPLAPSQLKTGRVNISTMGWSDIYNMQLRITHNQPLPLHVQAISMQLSINEK